MNLKKEFLNHKKITVMGAGKSGLSIARFLVKCGASVTLTDEKNEDNFDLSSLESISVHKEFGGFKKNTFISSDLIVVSPGIPPETHPLPFCKHIPQTNEVEIALQNTSVPVIAITGTNGKSTTTALIGEMLKAQGFCTFVGGNLGTPVIESVMTSQPWNYLVLELSSFMLTRIDSLQAHVGVITNIVANHLDYHQSFENYVQAKIKLMKLMHPNGHMVLNGDNVYTNSLSPSIPTYFFSSHKKKWGQSTFCVFDSGTNEIKLQNNPYSYPSFSYKNFKLPGVHNLENLMAAICSVWPLGVSKENIEKVMKNYPGLPHRIEFVGEKNGIRIYNDSKSTNFLSLKTALAAFNKKKLILIMGGKDKGTSFTPLLPDLEEKCKIVIVTGEASQAIANQIPFAISEPQFDKALQVALSTAKDQDIILFSPGCVSYDRFNNFEHRGETFKQLMHSYFLST